MSLRRRTGEVAVWFRAAVDRNVPTGPMAQSEERRTRIAEVVGSNPIRSTTTLHDGRRFGAVV